MSLNNNNNNKKFTYLIDNPVTIVFAAFISIWSVFFIEYWQRRQAELQFEWDTDDFEKNIETIRPEFELKVKQTKTNPITGVYIFKSYNRI